MIALPGLIDPYTTADSRVTRVGATAAGTGLTLVALDATIGCGAADVRQWLVSQLRLGHTVVIGCDGNVVQTTVALEAIASHDIDTRHVCLGGGGGSGAAAVHSTFLAALNAGISTVRALQMASLNPAVHFGMDHEVGSITPGRWADLFLVQNLGQATPDIVALSGVVRPTGTTGSDFGREKGQ